MMMRVRHAHRGFRPMKRDSDCEGEARRRRTWSAEEKARLVAESNVPGANVSEVARRAGVGRGLLNDWRREAAQAEPTAPASFVPVEVVADESVGADAGNRHGEGGTIEIDVAAARVTIHGAADPALARAIVSALRGQT